MKRSLLALAALTAFAGVASAQSSVTLFGIVDLNLRNQKNGAAGSIKSMSQDGINSSRFGVRGVEDIGGGMRAGFHLEGALNPDTGTPGGQTWQRRSTVSLMGGFGELRLGRDYTPTFWNHTIFDPFGTNGLGAATNTISTLGSGATTLVRSNNTIGYHLPAMGGLYGQAMISAGENVVGNKYMGGRLGYAAGPVNVAGAWGKTEREGAMVDDFTGLNFGASFKMGTATLMGQYGKYDYSTQNQKQLLVGVLVPVGAGTLKASFIKASGSSAGVLVDQYDASQMAFGYVHDLSKRTAVYGTFSRLNNGGTSVNGANFLTSGSGPAGMLRGATSSGYEFGLRHSF